MRFGAVTLAAMACGIALELVLPGSEATLSDIPGVILLSPVSVTVAGKAAAAGLAGALLMWGGCLFWPVWLLLGGACLRASRPAWVHALVFLWTLQAFFRPALRLAAVMSV